MQLDDTKHKVYIYDLDAELSDSDTSDDGKLVFLPDIEKHLRDTRIPPHILANSEGELAGSNLQLVLYNVPSSLTIPEEQDSVRRAIVETRARARARQEKRIANTRDTQTEAKKVNGSLGPRDWSQWTVNGHKSTDSENLEGMGEQPTAFVPAGAQDSFEDDPDAMDLG